MTENNITEYSTVEAKIRAIVSRMGDDVAYLFCNWAQANKEIDHIDKSTVVYVLPANGEMDFSFSQVKDCPETLIAFVDVTEFDFHGQENDCIIERMKRLAALFVKTLNESGYFEKIEGRVPYRVLYDTFDKNVTGIVISPKLEEVDGIRMCDIIARVDDVTTIIDTGDE